MNMARAGHGNSTENPFDAIGKAISGRSNNMQQGMLQAGMQGAEHAHELTMQERQQGHDVNMAVVGHVLGQDAADRSHKRNTHFFEAVNKHSEGGTGVKLGFGDTKLEYTRKASKPRPPKASPAKQQGPQLVGMPLNIATAGTPAAPASPAVAAKTQKYAHRDPVTNKISHYEDTPQVIKPAKKTAKKAAPKKKK